MKRWRFAVPVVAALMVSQAACASKQGDVPASDGVVAGDSRPATGSITISGTLTDEGAECRAMRDRKTNQLYTLTGDLAGFKPGERVRVVGTVAEVSFCMQGTTISVLSITRE